MNSKQRRQSERNHLHKIVLSQPSEMKYFLWDGSLYNMKVWCNKNARAGWKYKHIFQAGEFRFTKHEDAMMFALKWA